MRPNEALDGQSETLGKDLTYKRGKAYLQVGFDISLFKPVALHDFFRHLCAVRNIAVGKMITDEGEEVVELIIPPL